MPDVRDLFATTVAGLREPDPDPLAGTFERVHRRRRRRRVAGAALGLAGALVVGLALWATLPSRGGPAPIDTGPPVVPTYDVRVVAIEPAPPPHEDWVRLTYLSEWATRDFPGEARCLITANDASGSVLWTEPVNWTTMQRLDRGHTTVPETELPATATIECAPKAAATPIAGSYVFHLNSIELTDRALVVSYDLDWDSGVPGRLDTCEMRVTLPDGHVLRQRGTFELLHAPDLRMEFARSDLPTDLQPEEARLLPVSFDCGPFPS